MSLIHLLFLGVLPAGLFMWIGNQIRSRGTNKAGKRWSGFLLGGFVLSTVALVIANLMGDRAFGLSVAILLPILFGVTAAGLLHLIQKHNIGLTWSILLFLVILPLISLITLLNNWMFLVLFLLVAALTALAWLIWARNKKWYPAFFVLEVVLLGISIRVTDLSRVADLSPRWLSSIASTASYLVIPGMGIVLAALMLRDLFKNEGPVGWLAAIPTLFMVTVLFLLIGYQAVLISIWDVATDGLGWVFLWMTISTIGIGSAMLMAWSMPRRQLWLPILFALIVPLVMYAAQNLGTYDREHEWGTTPILLTERRAEKIEEAIQRYHERNNEYPQALSDLTPRYILYIPNPYIIPGLDWCYEGGIDHYRFGYVYRQFFSSPASVKIHSSAGDPSGVDWGCEKDAELYSAPLGF